MGAEDRVVGDLAAGLSRTLGRLIRLLRREVPSEVGPGSLAALVTLDGQGAMRLGDLAVREGVAPPTLTRMVSLLEAQGYVERRPDEQDRRAVRVCVTPAGAGLVREAVAARAVVLRARLAALPAAEVEALVAALPALDALGADAAHEL